MKCENARSKKGIQFGAVASCDGNDARYAVCLWTRSSSDQFFLCPACESRVRDNADYWVDNEMRMASRPLPVEDDDGV